MKRKSKKEIFLNGIIFENPLLVLMLGICPALSSTAQAATGLALGLVVLFTLTATNVMMSALKRVIPSQVRIPCAMVIIASFVTTARYLLTAYMPSVADRLGIYLPLIVVNCVILGRAEGFATKNSIADSVIDGIANGLGYTAALTLMGCIRELLGLGTVFGLSVTSQGFRPLTLFLLAPGGFLTLGVLVASANKLKKRTVPAQQTCASCPLAQSCSSVNRGGCLK